MMVAGFQSGPSLGVLWGWWPGSSPDHHWGVVGFSALISFCGWNWGSSGKGLGAVQPCSMHFSYRCVCLSGWGWGWEVGGSNHLTNANAGSRLRRRSSRRGLRLTEPASGISGAVKWPQAQPSVPVASSGVALILIHHCVTELSVSGWGWGDSVPARSVC